MKSLKNGGFLTRVAASAVIAGSVAGPVCGLGATITKAYTFTKSDVITALTAGTVYDNSVTAADGFSLVDPASSSTERFIVGDWISRVFVPNSQTARIEASVPVDYTLQSIAFSYSVRLVNWNALDNETTAQSVTYSISDILSLRRTGNAPYASITDSLNPTKSLGDDDDGALGVDGADFPFVPSFGGLDSYIEAPHGLNEAHPGTTSAELVDPLARPVVNSGTIAAGTDFTAYEGVAPGTVQTDFRHQGSATITSGTSVEGRFRVFSIGDFSITYTFVPEPGTWAAGVALVGIVAGTFVRRRSRGNPQHAN